MEGRIMRTWTNAAGTLILVFFGMLASGAAMAQHHHGARFGVYFGVPAYYPPYYPSIYSPYYPSPYYYPPAVVSVSPPVYVEQHPAQVAQPQQAQGDWYYCAASKSYYPYVNECVSGWQRVPAQPPAR
jgi:hypothetical protein